MRLCGLIGKCQSCGTRSGAIDWIDRSVAKENQEIFHKINYLDSIYIGSERFNGRWNAYVIPFLLRK
jgi:hypothetical protein